MNILNDTEKKTIEAKIAEIEGQTSGEIKVVIAKASPRWKYGSKNPVQTKALMLFKKHQIHKTIDATGVIVFFSLKERAFYIHADGGIYQKIGAETLNTFSQNLTEDMKAGRYCEGIIKLLDSIAIPLIQYFPIKEGDVNEISNTVIIEK
jgi:putative membrane protein